MKKDRVIRISCLICAALVIAAFWAGYYFGNTQRGTGSPVAEDISDLYLEKESDASETMSGISEEASHSSASDAKNITGSQKEESEEGNSSESSDSLYYLRKNGNYLSVYLGDSDEIYFDTGLKMSELPEDVQKQAETGIPFEDLEELYGFLENYSS